MGQNDRRVPATRLPPSGDWLTKAIRYKYWPAEYNAQIGTWAAKELRERVKLEDIKSIALWTYHWAWFETASEPEKWEPSTADTANHSLPYLFARMFLVGDLDLDAFKEEAFTDPLARDLMKRISIEHDEAMDEVYPATIPVRVECTTVAGEKVTIAIENPRGHTKNPMTKEETSEKFAKLAKGLLDDIAIKDALSFWWSLKDQSGLAKGMGLLAAN